MSNSSPNAPQDKLKFVTDRIRKSKAKHGVKYGSQPRSSAEVRHEVAESIEPPHVKSALQQRVFEVFQDVCLDAADQLHEADIKPDTSIKVPWPSGVLRIVLGEFIGPQKKTLKAWELDRKDDSITERSKAIVLGTDGVIYQTSYDTRYGFPSKHDRVTWKPIEADDVCRFDYIDATGTTFDPIKLNYYYEKIRCPNC